VTSAYTLLRRAGILNEFLFLRRLRADRPWAPTDAPWPPCSRCHAELAVPVEVTNSSLNVSVRALQPTGAWDPIQVQVLREPPSLRPIP